MREIELLESIQAIVHEEMLHIAINMGDDKYEKVINELGEMMDLLDGIISRYDQGSGNSTPSKAIH